MDPYRTPEEPPRDPVAGRWRARIGAAARAIVALAPLGAVGWLIAAQIRRSPCAGIDAARGGLSGASVLALACAIGVSSLLLTGTRLFPRS